jgi:uroporphyrinogen decarboxylase
VIGFAGAPFTVASYVIEGGSSKTFSKTKQLMRSDPDTWHELLDRIAQTTAAYLSAQIKAGAQAIQLFDSWVGCLSPEEYRTYVLPHSNAIFVALPQETPAIHFGAGSGLLLEALKEAGGSVIGVDYRISLKEAWKRLGSVAVQGNLDPTVLLCSHDVIRREAQSILDQASRRPGHIFNLGHGILPNTPEDNVRFLIDFVHEASAR